MKAITHHGMLIIQCLFYFKYVGSITLASHQINLTMHVYTATWNKAQATCVNNGGMLFTEDSPERKIVLERYMPLWENKHVWVGLHSPSTVTVGQYGWTDCFSQDLTNFDNWKASHPEDATTQRCAFRDKNTAEWKGDSCQGAHRFVCQNEGDPCYFTTGSGIPAPSPDFEVLNITSGDSNSCKWRCLNSIYNNKNCWAVAYQDQKCTMFFTTDPFLFNGVTLSTSNWEFYVKNCYNRNSMVSSASPLVTATESTNPDSNCNTFSTQTTQSIYMLPAPPSTTAIHATSTSTSGASILSSTTTTVTTSTSTSTTATTPTAPTSTTGTTSSSTSSTTNTPTTSTISSLALGVTTPSSLTTLPMPAGVPYAATTSSSTSESTTTSLVDTSASPTTSTRTSTAPATTSKSISTASIVDTSASTSTTSTSTSSAPVTMSNSITTTSLVDTSASTTASTSISSAPVTTSNSISTASIVDTSASSTTSTSTSTQTSSASTNTSTPTTSASTSTTSVSTISSSLQTTHWTSNSTNSTTVDSTSLPAISTTNASTTPFSVITTNTTSNKTCLCSCSGVTTVLSNKTLQEKIDYLHMKLKVDHKALSSSVRKKTSARDDRPASQSVGYVAIVFGCIELSLLMAGDVMAVLSFLRDKFSM